MKCKSDILATSSPSLNIPALASFYGTSKQTEYSNLMSTFISAGALYQKKFSLDFHSMLAFFSAARCIMNLSSSSNCLLRTSDLEELEKRKDSTATLFGRIRCTGADTPCPFTQEEGQDPSPYESIAFIVHANSFLSTEVKLSCELDGKTAPLSSFYPDSLNAAGARVKHTPSDSILPILNHVKILYENALALEPTQGRNVAYLSGKIFWWICQAKPYDRGDPAIAEMLIRSLWRNKGLDASPLFKSTPWLGTVFAVDFKDLEKQEWILTSEQKKVMFNEEEYAARFGELFLQPPTWFLEGDEVHPTKSVVTSNI